MCRGRRLSSGKLIIGAHNSLSHISHYDMYTRFGGHVRDMQDIKAYERSAGSAASSAFITQHISLLDDYNNVLTLDNFLSKVPEGESEVVIALLRISDDFIMTEDNSFSSRCANGKSGHFFDFKTSK